MDRKYIGTEHLFCYLLYYTTLLQYYTTFFCQFFANFRRFFSLS
jgi:hypothetical protein